MVAGLVLAGVIVVVVEVVVVVLVVVVAGAVVVAVVVVVVEGFILVSEGAPLFGLLLWISMVKSTLSSF